MKTMLSHIPAHRLRKRKNGLARRRNIRRYKKQLEKEETEKHELISQIAELPRDLKGKLYIHAMRNYWRNYIPLTAQVPSWRTRQIAVEKEMFDSRLQNIHSMHLSYNTLPENKTWIPGCQCEFCREYVHTHPIKTENKFSQIASDWRYFERDHLPDHDRGTFRYYVEDTENEELIDRIINAPGFKENIDHDPLYDTVYQHSTSYSLQKGIPLRFIIHAYSSDSDSDND